MTLTKKMEVGPFDLGRLSDEDLIELLLIARFADEKEEARKIEEEVASRKKWNRGEQ